LLFFVDTVANYPDIVLMAFNYDELAKAMHATHLTNSPLSYHLQYKFT